MGQPRQFPGADSPAGILRKVTKSDSADLPDGVPFALLIGTAGTLNMVDDSGTDCAAVPAQQGYNPIRPRRIKAGGTADDIWALY